MLKNFLQENEKHVVAIHCKAGKGRTGVMVCCWLLHSKFCCNANESIDFYGEIRTKNGKGLTIPSQIRYVRYYEKILQQGNIPTKKVHLNTLRFHTVPDYDPQGGCDPYIRVYVYKELDFVLVLETDPLDHVYRHKNVIVDIDCQRLEIEGDVKIILMDRDNFADDDHMCHFWFNTCFIENDYLVIHKSDLDKANKDIECKHFLPEFKIELFFNDYLPSSHVFRVKKAWRSSRKPSR